MLQTIGRQGLENHLGEVVEVSKKNGTPVMRGYISLAGRLTYQKTPEKFSIHMDDRGVMLRLRGGEIIKIRVRDSTSEPSFRRYTVSETLYP